VAKHKGLRISLIGMLIFLVSIAMLTVGPDIPARLGMVMGGVMVWGGLIKTIMDMSSSGPEEPLPPR
jgi:hypothetical protein